MLALKLILGQLHLYFTILLLQTLSKSILPNYFEVKVNKQANWKFPQIQEPNSIIKIMSFNSIEQLPERVKGPHLDRCTKTQLATNLFKVNFKEDANIYIYTLRTLPQIPRQNGKKLRSMLMINRNIIQRLIGPYVISGRTLFATKLQQLPKGDELNLRLEHQSTAYQVFLKVVKQVILSDIYSPEKQKSGIVYSFLNNMIKNFFHLLDYTEIGRSKKYFDSKTKVNLNGAQVTIFKGYSSSFSLLQTGLYFKVDSAVKIVRKDSVLDVINQVYKINSALSKQQKRAVVLEQLIGKQVMANYGKNKYYEISNVLFDICLESYKFNDGKKDINIIEYYKDVYNISIQSKRQPLVQVKSDKKKKSTDKPQEIIVLIPELLLMSGLPDNFDERKRREISETTIVQPQQKLGQIQGLFQKFNNSALQNFGPDLVAEKLGIQFNKNPTVINGKILNSPELQLGDKDKIERNKVANFMLFNKPLYSPDISLKVAVIYPSEFDWSPTRTIFESTSRSLNLQHKLIPYPINYSDTKQSMNTIESTVRRQCQNGSANIFWFIIPPYFKKEYKNLKRFMLKVDIAKNSQVCVTTTLQKKGAQSIVTKILLQIAAKVGNKLWVPRVPTKILHTGVLIIGIQSYGDNQNKNKTVVSFCSNTNKQFSSFYSSYFLQNKHDNHIKMKEIIFECLNQYIMANQTPPTDVIILKNGSGKYDLTLSVQADVTEIKEIFRAVSISYTPIKLVYIIVDKQASIKFFNDRNGQVSNPGSGTLVNSEAVGNNFQFYLIAQHCNRGTVRPTYYKVVYSDSLIEQGVIQQLLFTQCFNYMNWTGAIKVPGMLQYAKKLGMFIGQYINKDSEETGMHKYLYYI